MIGKGVRDMTQSINITAQGFEELRANGDLYLDKTSFVRDWWFSGPWVTLVCRPKGFGKTLNLDTVRCFLSRDYAGRGEDLFGGLDVWEGGSPEERDAMRALQGTVPVVALSFADVRQESYEGMVRHLGQIMLEAVEAHAYLLDWDEAHECDRALLQKAGPGMSAFDCADVIETLCRLLERYHGVKPVVILDDYDTPVRVAYVGGFWGELRHFMQAFLCTTFKTNRNLSRGLIAGEFGIYWEDAFSDLSLMEVTTSTRAFQTAFGLTQEEVDAALPAFGLEGMREDVADWYGGHTFGGSGPIYNPFSVVRLLKYGALLPYWADACDNRLADALVRRAGPELMCDLEDLMQGGHVETRLREGVALTRVGCGRGDVLSLLLDAGYLRVPGPVPHNLVETPRRLEVANRDAMAALDRMVTGWFKGAGSSLENLIGALFSGDAGGANRHLADLSSSCMPSFDGGVGLD